MPTGCGKHEIADYLTGACLFLSFPDSETLGQELFSTPFTTRARISPGLNFPSISTAAVLPGATVTAKETSPVVFLLRFLLSDGRDGQPSSSTTFISSFLKPAAPHPVHRYVSASGRRFSSGSSRGGSPEGLAAVKKRSRGKKETHGQKGVLPKQKAT